MEKIIGGLFKTKELTVRAYQALQEAGFEAENITILEPKLDGIHRDRKRGTSKSVGRSAFTGALIFTGIAAILGLLIGQGIIDVPAFMPDFKTPTFSVVAFSLFLAQGAVTGAIIGVVFRLAAAREKPVIDNTGITRGGLILAVNSGENQGKQARNVMEAAGAIDLADLSEKWEAEVWTKFKELNPPSLAK